MMEAICSSEMSVPTRARRRHMPEDGSPRSRRSEPQLLHSINRLASVAETMCLLLGTKCFISQQTAFFVQKSCRYRNSNSDPSSVQPPPSGYIHCAIPAPTNIFLYCIYNLLHISRDLVVSSESLFFTFRSSGLKHRILRIAMTSSLGTSTTNAIVITRFNTTKQ
jgi:hypothetical protein